MPMAPPRAYFKLLRPFRSRRRFWCDWLCVRSCALGRQAVAARRAGDRGAAGASAVSIKHLYDGDHDRGRQYAEILRELTGAIRRVGQYRDPA